MGHENDDKMIKKPVRNFTGLVIIILVITFLVTVQVSAQTHEPAARGSNFNSAVSAVASESESPSETVSLLEEDAASPEMTNGFFETKRLRVEPRWSAELVKRPEGVSERVDSGNTVDDEKAKNAQDDQPAQEPNNGTDPTRLTTSITLSSEYTSLKDRNYINNIKFVFSRPIGKAAMTNYQIKLLFVNTNVLGNNQIGFGDLAIKITNVTKLTKKYGIVFSGEMNFATASRTELGTGKNVFKGAFIYVKFLPNGYIFAPSFLHSISIWGKSNRANVNNTTIDFYIVPKLKDPKTFITIDPALTLDYVGKKQFGSVAVTVGRAVGKMFGGNGQIYVKPTVFIGGESPGYWGLEAGMKILGF
jgi:hypothetical protein